MKRDRKSTPKGKAWELLDGQLLACGHSIAQARREAASADHCQDSEAPIVWHRLSASPDVDAHGVSLSLVTVSNIVL